MDVMEKQENLYRTIGRRIKERRKVLRITQTQLADFMGISYQQIQKYEAGLNNISLSRLMQFARLLNVPPEHFYQGVSLDEAIGAEIESDVIRSSRPHHVNLVLVDDNMDDALLFKESMTDCQAAATLHCIHDSDKVMDYLTNYGIKYNNPPPDVVILDLNMPKINGLKVLKEIKGNSQTSMIPVIVLTNSISRKEMQEAYRLGAAGFIQKSIDFEEYKESVEILVQYWSKVVALPTK